MTRARGRSMRVGCSIIVLVMGHLPAIPAPTGAAEQAEPRATGARGEADVSKQVVDRLKADSESEPALHGVLVRMGEQNGGTIHLSGSVDRPEQKLLLEQRASRLLAEEPSWKEQLPGGVTARGMLTFPVRSELLPRLRRSFAGAGDEPPGMPGLLRQTRLDDVYFDRRGGLHIVGLCINRRAFFASQIPNVNLEEAPLTLIAHAVRDRIQSFPLPAGVDPGVLRRLHSDRITFAGSPTRMLQSWANESSQLDDAVFVDAHFNAAADLVVAGLLGREDQRALAAALLERPEFVKTYGRPGTDNASLARAALAEMSVKPWRQELVSGLQKRFAQELNRGAPRSALRYCRLDRAVFTYAERGGLQLRFEGLAFLDGDQSVHLGTLLRDESRRLFQLPRKASYNIEQRLTVLPNPRRKLHGAVAAVPAVDGVRIDDLVFGSRGEPTIEGIWVGPGQQPALEALLVPVVVESAPRRISGPLSWRMAEVPTDRLLRGLRAKVAEAFDETSLDRLSFQFPPGGAAPANPGEAPVLTLQGATIGPLRKVVERRLGEWVKESDLVKPLGSPAVALATRPGSLLAKLRERVTHDRALDGVRIDRGMFDEDNALVLAGLQDHGGQAELLIPLAQSVAAAVWNGLPPPRIVKTGGFRTHALRPMLEKLARVLTDYPEADGVLITRAHYAADLGLVLAGSTTKSDADRPDLEELINSKEVLALDPKNGVRLILRKQPGDPDHAKRLMLDGVQALIGNRIASFEIDSLDQAVFLDPGNSTAWYLRAAHYLERSDIEQAKRDMRRALRLEKNDEGLRKQRGFLFEGFQTPLRSKLKDLEHSVGPVS